VAHFENKSRETTETWHQNTALLTLKIIIMSK